MTDPQVTEWIQIQLKAGYSTREVYDTLLKQGHKPDNIVSSFREAQQIMNQQPQSQKKMPAIVGVALGVMLVFLAIGFLWPSSPSGATVTDTTPEVVALQDQPPVQVSPPAVKQQPKPAYAPTTAVPKKPRTQTKTVIKPPVKKLESPVKEPETQQTSKPKDDTFECNDLPCFYTKFRYCTKATVTENKNAMIQFYYEILAETDDGCRVKTTVIAEVDKEVVGKTMICTYDHSKDFRFATKDAHTTYNECTGDLADIYKPRLDEKQYIDCGTSFDCYYNQKRKCEPTRALIDGVLYHIEGFENHECVIRQSTV